MKLRFGTIGAAVALAMVSAALATERHVPGQYTTIGSAIFASSDGDVVIVHPGTYTGTNNRDISFMGKAITVRSVDPNDPAVVAATVINCQGSEQSQHRGFWIHSGEGSGSIVDGLTIRNGWIAAPGGGIYCNGTSPTISRCVLDSNVSAGNVSEGGGGGIACWSGGPTISECLFVGNTGRVGGAISWGAQGTLRILRCLIAQNRATDEGGGLYLGGGNPVVVDCQIANNVAWGVGAGIFAATDTTLVNVEVTGNTLISTGGNNGAGIYCRDLTMLNCTISGNRTTSADSFGGGIYNSGSSDITVRNCIISGNVATNGAEIALLGGAAMTINSTLVFGGEATTYVSFDSILNWGAGNVDADPVFFDPDGPDDDPETWQDNDYWLAAGSPCIDAGDNAAVPADTFDLDGDGNTTEPTPFDLDGNPRFVDDPATADTGEGTAPIVDMGAYEYQVAAACLPCDANCDGSVNQFDIQPFITAIATHAGCSPCAGDANGDGTVNTFDINGFIDCLIP